jgi:hypothetical protein
MPIWRSAIQTSAPPSTNLVASAAPMPDAPPVTNATFPDTLSAMGEE